MVKIQMTFAIATGVGQIRFRHRDGGIVLAPNSGIETFPSRRAAEMAMRQIDASYRKEWGLFVMPFTARERVQA